MANNAPDRAMAMRLLAEAVATDRKGKAGVARLLGAGFGRSLLSRVLSPNDPLEMSDDLARRVIDTLHVVRACPGTGTAQPIAECWRITSTKAPTHNPHAMRIWKACQTCPHKPTQPAGDTQ